MAQMKIKPSKSKSIIIKGKMVDHRFYICDEAIPLVSEKPIKSLGRWYSASLKEQQVQKDAVSGLETIDKTYFSWQTEGLVRTVWTPSTSFVALNSV